MPSIGDKLQMPLVSVVTPFYNTEQYLSECIESVLGQSYKSLEYILVNNCSTDRSLQIANHYAEKDSRIIIYSNETFLTQPQNYNRALSLISAESKYCKIVQADDWMFPDCLSEMVKVANSHHSVGIVGAYRLDDKIVNCTGLPYPSTFVAGTEICRMTLLDELSVFGSATTVMFRSNIVRSRNPFYSESSRHEDTEACFEILQDYDYGFVHKVLTFTRRENESITTTIRRYDPFYLLCMYILVQKYGLCYLSDEEYEKCYKDIRGRYYRYLAEKWLLSKDKKALLDYHNQGLNDIGQMLSRYETAKYVIKKCINMILDLNIPVRMLLRIFRKVKKIA
jgi:glycosyltransferase involved in cell wall biosynthesis